MRIKRTWHPNFIEYTKYIANHENYKTLPHKFGKDGKLHWVSASDQDQARWWDQKATELGLPNRAEVARTIHPRELGGYKPCQICGKKLSIFYVYPNKNTIKRFEKHCPNIKIQPFTEDIGEIFDLIQNEGTNDVFEVFNKVFIIPENIVKSKKSYINYLSENCRSKLSPGVMCNPPDRLDGFHTYNACCRSEEDTGRHITNLARYTQDRRAYENWADGNWNLSNRLMGEYGRYQIQAVCSECGRIEKLSADHIGPISLGFMHRDKFRGICKSCNSAKNNRMTLRDINDLLGDEKKGLEVISWHSKYLWDKLKSRIKSERDAVVASKVMRENLHHILTLFSSIKDAGYKNFLLRYLSPQYSFYDYKFENFDPINGPGKIIARELDSVNKRKNAARYIRISLESLDDYRNKENRKNKQYSDSKIISIEKRMSEALKDNNYSAADRLLKKIIELIANYEFSRFETEI